MKAVIQRVREAVVTCRDKWDKAYAREQISAGLVVLVCIMPGDTVQDAEWLARKIANMRIFDDDEGVMNLSVLQTGGDVMVVSQFTLAANVRKGNRPSFTSAASPQEAGPLFNTFCKEMTKTIGKMVPSGIFGAHMRVSLTNDGPVTIIIDTKESE